MKVAGVGKHGGAERGLRKSRHRLVFTLAEGPWVGLASRSLVVQQQEGRLGTCWSILDGFIVDLSRGRGVPEVTS